MIDDNTSYHKTGRPIHELKWESDLTCDLEQWALPLAVSWWRQGDELGFCINFLCFEFGASRLWTCML